MANLVLNGQSFQVPYLAQIIPGKEAEVREAVRDDGLDNVILGNGKDIYVASGRKLPLKGVHDGTTGLLNGKPVTVIGEPDNEVNSALEAIRAHPGVPSAVAVSFGGIGMVGLAKEISYLKTLGYSGKVLRSLSLDLAPIHQYLVLGALEGLAATAIYGRLRPAHPERIYGDQVRQGRLVQNIN